MTAPDLPIDDPPRRRLRAGPLVADVAGLGLLGLVALSGLGPTYGGVRYLVVGAIGLAAGIALAVGFAARRWSVGLLTVAVIAVYLIAGRWLIAADRPLDPVLPSPGSVSTMVSGAVRGWANVLTTIPPVGAAQNLLAVPFAIGIAAGAASLTIARRSSRWWLLAALPPAVAFVVAVLLGVDRPAWTLQATAFAVVALLWGAYRQRRARTGDIEGRGRRPWLSGALVVAGAAAVGLLLGQSTLVGGERPRSVLRDRVEPPVELLSLASPLEGFRSYRTPDRRDEVLFRIEGLEDGDRIRLATLDHYDGVVWHVQSATGGDASSGLFQRVGERLPVGEEGERRSITVEVVEGDGPWVPTVGSTGRIRFDGDRATRLAGDFRYNLATHTGVATGGLSEGDRYRLDAIVPDPHPDLTTGDADPTASAPDPAVVDAVADLVDQLLASESAPRSPLARARAVEAIFSGADADAPLRGYFSDGGCPTDRSPDPDSPCVPGQQPSRPGHSAERIRTLLDPERGYFLGNEEQFASAMALVASRVGLPARVVMGFVPDVADDGVTEVHGRDVSAWAEVAVAGVGWIPLDPTPTDTDPPDQEVSQRPPPDRLFPAPPTPAPDDLPGAGGGRGDAPDDAPSAAEGLLGGVPRWVTVAGGVVGTPIVLVGAATAVLGGIKAGRRRRRRSRGTPTERVAAGWDEVCDLARDLGEVVPVRATRRESAIVLARPGVEALAASTDRLAFRPGGVDGPRAERYWRDVDEVRASMRQGSSVWARWKALVSPASLRRRR